MTILLCLAQAYEWETDLVVGCVILLIVSIIAAVAYTNTEDKNYYLSKRNTYSYTYGSLLSNLEDSKSKDSVNKYIAIKRAAYDEWLKQAQELQKFLQSLSKDKEFLELLVKQYGITDYGGEITQDNCFPLFGIYDTYVCSVGLGHNVEGSTREAILFYGMAKMIATGRDYVPAKDFEREKTGYLIKSAMQLLTQMPDDHEFAISRVLSLYDNDQLLHYHTLLYRYASVLAKADGIVTGAEEKYLAHIMELSKGGTQKSAEGQAVAFAAIEDRDTADDDPKTDETEAAADAADTSKPKPKRPKASRSIKRLNSLVGLASVKEDVTKLSNFIKIAQVRQEHGLAATPISYHCVFTGNPGTGKTTVARIIAGIYRELGVLSKGHLVETDRSGLVAEYVGQTAVKTNKVIDSALDGILFIDEAYSLATGSQNDYGPEAIATLLKRMEDDRKRLVVILAGYGEEMKTFINSNPGLASRFNRYIHFPDYNSEELYEIFLRNVQKHQYALSPEAGDRLKALLAKAVADKDQNFGNARYARNLFEKALENQASRLASVPDLTTEVLMEITADDIKPAD